MTLTYQRFRAPARDGETLQVPPLSGFTGLLERNRDLLSRYDRDLAGIPMQTLRQAARSQLVAAAARYTRQYRDVQQPENPQALIMAGHQPTLFHPGVWYKNFALHELAARTGSWAVNLVVDNDHQALRAIKVPVGGRRNPGLRWLHYDDTVSGGAFETETLHDRRVFESFGEQVRQAIRPWIEQPLVEPMWPYAVECIDVLGKPSLALAAGRHRLEADFGLQTLEIPMSQVCQLPVFASFAAELIDRAADFLEVHNRELSRFRELNRIRSTSHPVPDLKTVDDWLETPFWVWRVGADVRRPLFVRLDAHQVFLSDRQEMELRLDRSNLTAELHALETAGISLRTRALTTTLFARLVLSDAFLHGIGGGKYDQLSDEIVQGFFQVPPPEFNVLSATYRLPIPYPRVSESDLQRLQNRRRDMYYHAERFVDCQQTAFRELADRKRQHLRSMPIPGSRKAWHDQMDRLNESLRSALQPERRALQAEIDSARHGLQIDEVLGSREFSFCLFDHRLVEQLGEIPNTPSP